MAIIAPQNQNNQQEQQQPAPTPQTSAATPSAPTPTSMPNANQPKGSGRFTNIQKYIGANQGAGQRLAGGVEKRVQSQVNPNVEKAQSQASQIAEQVNKAQGTLGQGQQLRSQVEQQNFDAQAFAAQEPNVQQFTQFRTGQAIDENALRGQAEQAQIQAQQAQQQAQQFGQQLGTEAGRQQLLKQTFSPTRNYTVGQQRLDNLFLQQASPQLRNLSQNLNLTQQQLGNLGAQAEQKRQAIQDLAGQEQELAQGLTAAIGAREQDVVGAAEARQDEVNKARQAAQEMSRQQFQNLLEGKEINQDFAGQLGLTEQDRLYNVLKNQGSVDDYLKFNPTLLQGANQLASQEQRQKYDAIARLAGLDPSQRRIGLEDKTQAAVESTGQLRSRIDEAAKKFQEMLPTTTATGTAVSSDLFKPAMGTATSNINLQQGLQSIQNIDPQQIQALQNYINQTGAYGLGTRAVGAPVVSGYEWVNPINAALQNYNLNTTIQPGYGAVTNATARARALLDVYNRLNNEGYYNQARIANPTLKKLPEPT